MTDFAGKTILVSGATSGIGRATAIAFAKAGAMVVAVGRRAREGQETLDLIREAGGEAAFRPLDVGIEADVAPGLRRHRRDCRADRLQRRRLRAGLLHQRQGSLFLPQA
jgi:NAD(P)-dependent dehydrogenase (short-subunit alcohol dehydrogenase family)